MNIFFKTGKNLIEIYDIFENGISTRKVEINRFIKRNASKFSTAVKQKTGLGRKKKSLAMGSSTIRRIRGETSEQNSHLHSITPSACNTNRRIQIEKLWYIVDLSDDCFHSSPIVFRKKTRGRPSTKKKNPSGGYFPIYFKGKLKKRFFRGPVRRIYDRNVEASLLTWARIEKIFQFEFQNNCHRVLGIQVFKPPPLFNTFQSTCCFYRSTTWFISIDDNKKTNLNTQILKQYPTFHPKFLYRARLSFPDGNAKKKLGIHEVSNDVPILRLFNISIIYVEKETSDDFYRERFINGRQKKNSFKSFSGAEWKNTFHTNYLTFPYLQQTKLKKNKI